jgi:cytochrome c oxidase subunit 4
MSDAAIDHKTIAIETERYHHFITLALWLAAITGVEIVLIYIKLDPALILGVLALLSAIKFFAVILWFMHLIYDARLLFWLFFAGLALAFATFAAMIVLFSTDRIDTKWFS